MRAAGRCRNLDGGGDTGPTLPGENGRAIHGQALRNSATDPVGIEGLVFNDVEWVVEFITNLIDWPGIFTAQGLEFNGETESYEGDARGTVNSVELTLTVNGQERVFRPETLRFLSFAIASHVDSSGLKFTKVVYHLLERPGGWRYKLPDKGLNSYNSSLDSVPIKRVDEERNEYTITSPVYLNGNGQEANVGDEVKFLPQGDFVAGDKIGKGFEMFKGVDLGTLLLWGWRHDGG